MSDIHTVLVTGGTGFIGSHTCVELVKAGYDIVVLDNLSNSCEAVLDRIEQVCGTRPAFVKGDILNEDDLDGVFSNNDIDAVIHFAGLKAVGESVERPLLYYRNNIEGTLKLCEAMKNHDVHDIVFSSSATVYGKPAFVPITEDCPKQPATNPYGWTKSMIEQILTDIAASDPTWNVMLLRYFNPIGAHESGLMGENPRGIPNNLMPYITQVAIGKLDHLRVFGDDYDTPDGTGVRDYIHVVDLAYGHVCALHKLRELGGVQVFNLGTGTGYSVLDVVHAFERANDIEIPYTIEARRAGDIDENYCDPTRARELLGWTATRDLEQMCRDSWNWQQKNPDGYEG
jgi:UDP-glucose 4-epimerase